MEWNKQNINTTLNILEPGVSDHALLSLQGLEASSTRRRYFKFQNVVTNTKGLFEAVKENWLQPLGGSDMYIPWKKLQRLQHIIKEKSKPFSGIQQKIKKAEEELRLAQQNFSHNMMNGYKI